MNLKEIGVRVDNDNTADCDAFCLSRRSTFDSSMGRRLGLNFDPNEVTAIG